MVKPGALGFAGPERHSGEQLDLECGGSHQIPVHSSVARENAVQLSHPQVPCAGDLREQFGQVRAVASWRVMLYWEVQLCHLLPCRHCHFLRGGESLLNGMEMAGG